MEYMVAHKHEADSMRKKLTTQYTIEHILKRLNEEQKIRITLDKKKKK